MNARAWLSSPAARGRPIGGDPELIALKAAHPQAQAALIDDRLIGEVVEHGSGTLDRAMLEHYLQVSSDHQR